MRTQHFQAAAPPCCSAHMRLSGAPRPTWRPPRGLRQLGCQKRNHKQGSENARRAKMLNWLGVWEQAWAGTQENGPRAYARSDVQSRRVSSPSPDNSRQIRTVCGKAHQRKQAVFGIVWQNPSNKGDGGPHARRGHRSALPGWQRDRIARSAGHPQGPSKAIHSEFGALY